MFVLQEQLKQLIDENFKTCTEFAMRDPCLFGDYRTALEDSEPRLYEDIQDYDAAKALFQEVSKRNLFLLSDATEMILM